MDKQVFMNRLEMCFVSKEDFMKDLQILLDKKIITDKDIEKMEDTFIPIYAVAAAIYDLEIGWFLHGGSDSTNRKTRRMKNYYRRFL
ncbi:MAG: hypothetical protein E7108_01820 [Bacteroidales bacterium]|nr:hypothetical protein [Bacteroidales bacterium]